MNRLHLAVVSPRIWPVVGEIEWAASNLATALSELGHEVSILTSRLIPHWPTRFRIRSCTVYRLPQRHANFGQRRSFDRAWLRFIKENRTHFHGVISLPLGWPRSELISQCNKLDLPTVVRIDPTFESNLEVDQAFVRLRRARAGGGEKECVRWAATTCRFQAKLHRHQFPVQLIADGVPDPVCTIGPNARELAESREERQKRARESLSRSSPLLRIGREQKIAVFGGPVTSDQGLERWIQAWKYVIKQCPQARFWIVGEGSFLQPLWERIHDRNLQEYVFLGGMFDDLAVLYDAADLFLLGDARRLDSPWVLQAQSRDLPVMTSFAVPQSERTANRAAVVETSSDDPKTLAKAISEILLGTRDVKKISETARLSTRQFHNMETCARNYLNLIAESL